MSSSIFMIWNSLVTIPLELDTDLHSPHSNGNFERQDLRDWKLRPARDRKKWFFGVTGWPGIHWKNKKIQRILTAGRAPSSSAELGQQSKSLIFELGRPRPSSAELGRGEPSSAQLGRAQPRMPTEPGPKKCDFPRSRWPKNEFL